jgi:hypothetical protein
MHNHKQFTAELKKNRYIDNYIDKWLKLDTLDKPYVECEICGYASNASIHQHLLIPKEFDSSDNRILHLCANCNYELRALIDRMGTEPERITQICKDAFEKLTDMKKPYKEKYRDLVRIEI